jgi:hypothetical protein
VIWGFVFRTLRIGLAGAETSWTSFASSQFSSMFDK